MKNYIQTLVLALTLLLFTACGGGSSADSTQKQAIDKLVAYANSNGTTEVPTLQDYLDVGVTGIDSDTQLAEINQVVEGLIAEDVDTTVEVQALADALGVQVPIGTVAPTPTTPIPTTPIDTTAPVISITGANPTIVIQGGIYTDEGVTAIDDVDGTVGSAVVGTIFVDINTLGSYTVTYTATDAAGNTATAIRTVNVVAAVSITHNGTTYGTVTSPHTGRVWLDRNLGAAQVCTSFDDVACYGDYYQWGRNSDGHEDSASVNTATQAVNVTTVGHGDFIDAQVANTFDWAEVVDANGITRIANWSAIDGSSVCPVEFRVPTITELELDTLNNGVTNLSTAFTNFLKLPSAGFRSNSSFGPSTVISMGTWGSVWSNSIGGSSSRYINFVNLNAGSSSVNRALGNSVRCIKD